MDQRYQVLVFNDEGHAIVNTQVDKKTYSIGNSSEADLQCAACENAFFYIHRSAQDERFVVLYDNVSSGDSFSLSVKPDVIKSVDKFRILISDIVEKEPVDTSDGRLFITGRVSVAIQNIMNWSQSSMSSADTLKKGLAEFLKICAETSNATNGLIVFKDDEGFDIVSTYRLTVEQAKNIWESMPDNLTQEIEEKKARSILPEGLATKVSDETTVFVEDVKSLAGFPILAEEKLVGILYLGYDNLIRSLSISAQKGMEVACCMAGLIIQRGMLRNEISNLKISKSNEMNWLKDLPAQRLMVGSSQPLAEVYKLIKRMAPVGVATLINGETGTGKELAAKEIWRLSDRAESPFVAVNASALPENLFESELFGHKKGSFTGATSDHKGYIEQANGGTLFIDEIGEIPLNLQSKLLRVLQEKQIVRVGETKPIDVDFRLVAATHCNLLEKVESGDFREDLYYRIAGAIIKMPSLKDRKEDICELANYFKQRFNAAHKLGERHFSPAAISFLESYSWPGNIRQLENVVSRSCVMAENKIIEVKDIRPFLDGAEEVESSTQEREVNFDNNVLEPIRLSDAKDQWLRDYLKKSLQFHNGNKVKTAEALGIGQRTLFRYIEQLELKSFAP